MWRPKPEELPVEFKMLGITPAEFGTMLFRVTGSAAHVAPVSSTVKTSSVPSRNAAMSIAP